MSSLQFPSLILRVPDNLASLLHKILDETNNNAKDEEGLSIKVERDTSESSEYYNFIMADKEYPALLGNCPSLLEAYKTFDTKVVLKSGDIGQMLYVFENDEDRMKMANKIQQTESGSYLPHGVTIPTYNIIERKYKKTKKHKKKIAFKIAETIDQIDTPWEYAQTATDARAESNIKEHVQVFEEVVPFEEWMYDSNTNKTIALHIDNNFEGNSKAMSILLEHPNLLISQLDLDEERELEEEEQMRRALAIDRNTGAETLRNIVSQTLVSESKEDARFSIRMKDTSSSSSMPLPSYADTKKDSDSDESDSDDDFDLDAALQSKPHQRPNDDEMDIESDSNPTVAKVVTSAVNRVEHRRIIDEELSSATSSSDEEDDWMNAELT